MEQLRIPDDKPIAMLTVGELRAVIASAMAERPALDADAPRDAQAIAEVCPGVSPGWLRAHVPAVGRGARQRPLYRLSDVRAALEASPVQPKARAKMNLPGDDAFRGRVRRRET